MNPNKNSQRAISVVREETPVRQHPALHPSSPFLLDSRDGLDALFFAKLVLLARATAIKMPERFPHPHPEPLSHQDSPLTTQRARQVKCLRRPSRRLPLLCLPAPRIAAQGRLPSLSTRLRADPIRLPRSPTPHSTDSSRPPSSYPTSTPAPDKHAVA
jgi:hypothetical protein